MYNNFIIIVKMRCFFLPNLTLKVNSHYRNLVLLSKPWESSLWKMTILCKSVNHMKQVFSINVHYRVWYFPALSLMSYSFHLYWHRNFATIEYCFFLLSTIYHKWLLILKIGVGFVKDTLPSEREIGLWDLLWCNGVC